MHADWEVEIGGDAAVIDAAWEGFVDLRAHPEDVVQVSETENLPSLANALLRLNAPESPVWTAKCDVWALGETDIDEMGASPEDAAHAVACYIDLLSHGESWNSLEGLTDVCRGWCASLAQMQGPCCRADFIVRAANVGPGPMILGVTTYLSACGRTEADAEHALGKALESAIEAITGNSPAVPGPKYNKTKAGE